MFNCQKFATILAVLYSGEYGKIKILGDWACRLPFFLLEAPMP